MPISDIIDKIKKDAEEQAKQIYAEAQAEASRIKEESKKQASAEASRIIGEAENATKEKRREGLSTIYAEEAEAKEAAFDRVVEKETNRLMAQLKKQVKAKYMERFIEAAIEQFLENVPAAEAVASAPAKYAEIFKKHGIKTEAGSDHIIIRSLDNKIRMEISADSIAGQYRNKIESLVASALKQKKVV